MHFLGSQGEAESSEEAFQTVRFEFFGRNPVDSESGTEGGGESGFGVQQRNAGRTTELTATIDLDSLPHLSVEAGRFNDTSRRQMRSDFQKDTQLLPLQCHSCITS